MKPPAPAFGSCSPGRTPGTGRGPSSGIRKGTGGKDIIAGGGGKKASTASISGKAEVARIYLTRLSTPAKNTL
jgi:hypothetical protein